MPVSRSIVGWIERKRNPPTPGPHKGGGFRAATLMSWPADKLAKELVRLNAESASDELELLQLLYVDLEPAIQITFLDAAGVSHENGTMPEDLEMPYASAEAVAKIKSPLQLHYAGADERVNAGWPAYDAALKAAAVPHEAFVYAGTQHGFNNDTTPRFDAKAAALAWQRTMAFFKAQLAVA